jgi:plastocyanin
MSRLARFVSGVVLAGVAFAVGPHATPAFASEPVLQAASYPGMTTYSCRTDAIPILPGQNRNLFGSTKTCPNAEVVRGPGGTQPFAPGSTAQGFVTRFRPSMVEILPDGRTKTPRVDDLHLHHVVWMRPGGGPTFAAGEEKTIVKLPRGYGLRTGGDANWGLNYMIHNLTATDGRRVFITWEIDWVPAGAPAAAGIKGTQVRWLDVAGAPQIYPVFDAERRFDLDGDGRFVFPDDVLASPDPRAHEEFRRISNARRWRVPQGGVTLVFGAGHLHPGGSHVDLHVSRDGPDPGNVAGDHPSETRGLFRSGARYYEPAGAVSWDVSMKATPPKWRIRLKARDVLWINATYNVKRASWYESMGILPVSYSTEPDPAARDPFDDPADLARMKEGGGILTHGRLPENIDRKARKNLKLPDPRKLRDGRLMPGSGVQVDNFYYGSASGRPLGGFSSVRGFPASQMRPAVVAQGSSVTFTNLDAMPGSPEAEQVWHSITSCKPPCNRGAGIGYPLARGPGDFDSGELGYGEGASASVTTGSNEFTTQRFGRRGTFTYFCRIHPFMRGSFRVRAEDKLRKQDRRGKKGKRGKQLTSLGSTGGPVDLPPG